MELHDGQAPFESAPLRPQSPLEDDRYDLAPAELIDPVIEAYKKDIDRTLLIENLRLSVADRLAKFQDFMNMLGELRGAALPPDVRERLFGKRDDRVRKTGSGTGKR
jgi:hypothetical protein